MYFMLINSQINKAIPDAPIITNKKAKAFKPARPPSPSAKAVLGIKNVVQINKENRAFIVFYTPNSVLDSPLVFTY